MNYSTYWTLEAEGYLDLIDDEETEDKVYVNEKDKKPMRLTEKYGIFTPEPYEFCLEVFQRVADAEKYIDLLEKKGKFGYSIRTMTRQPEHIPIAPSVHLKWTAETDEEGRAEFYCPINNRSALRRIDIPTSDFADNDLICSPWAMR